MTDSKRMSLPHAVTQPIDRRTFLGGLTMAAVAGSIGAGRVSRGDLPAAAAGNDSASRAICLATDGGDRATAYGMSAKIVSCGERHLLCSWLDVAARNQNHWALVDAGSGEVARRGTVGPTRSDNHCGVALAETPDGAVDCMIGAHGGSFMHYRMPAGDEGVIWQLIENAIGQGATYPSLVCDRDGTLHLTYRRSTPRPYHIMYCRRRRDDRAWSEPRPLVRAAVPVHTWTTHALEIGPEGRVHLVLSNTQTLPDGAWYFGASHIYSDDSGDSWRQLGEARPLAPAVDAGALARIEGDGLDALRTLSAAQKGRLPGGGPSQYYYFKILLSNPVVDQSGRPWVVVHNLLRGEAELYHANAGAWTGTPLGKVLRAAQPDHHISHMGQLSRHKDGTMEVVLTVAPDDVESHRYGARGSKLVRILVDASGTPRTCNLVCEPDPAGIPDWQPNIQRPTRYATWVRPALLWTRGVNSHTLTEAHTNVNQVTTEVWLQLPPTGTV
jgi:hypothetical protein